MEEEKKKTSDSMISELVSQKVEVIDTAKKMGVDVKLSDSVLDIKKQVIAKGSKISLDGKSEEFIDGIYEMAKEKNVNDSQSKTFDGFTSGAVSTYDSIKDEEF